MAGAAGLGAGAVVSADIVRGDEELAIVEPISPMDEEVIGQNAEEVVTAEENKDSETQNDTVTPTENESHVTEPQPQVSDNATQPQGNSTTHVQPATENTVHAGEIDTNDIPDVDPRLVAQDITNDVIMVDPTDNDMGILTLQQLVLWKRLMGKSCQPHNSLAIMEKLFMPWMWMVTIPMMSLPMNRVMS